MGDAVSHRSKSLGENSASAYGRESFVLLRWQHTGEKKSEIVESQEHRPVYDAYIIGLTMDRSRLYERINARVDTMMEQGLLQEIEQLHTLQEDVWSLQSFQESGCKEWKVYIEDRNQRHLCGTY